jgi:hypothetical protein
MPDPVVTGAMRRHKLMRSAAKGVNDDQRSTRGMHGRRRRRQSQLCDEGVEDGEAKTAVQETITAMPEYLTCYDYGTGAVWLYLEAASPGEIKACYPDLTVFETPPAWWDAQSEGLTRRANASEPFWQHWLSKLKR